MIHAIVRLFTPRITLRTILEQHYAGYSRVAPQTMRRYRCELGRWERVVGDLPVRRISPEHFTLFRDVCVERGLSHSSTEGSVKVVKLLLRYAKDRGWVNALPVFGKSLRIPEPEVLPATMKELSALYEGAQIAERIGKGIVPPCDAFRAFLVLEYWTGIRGQNLISDLAWEHVTQDCIRFQQSKTSKRHIFPLHPIVSHHLGMVHGMDERFVLGLRSLQHVNYQLRRVCDHVGIRNLTSNHIREACFTSWMIADETAGKVIHGCGLPTVLQRHYIGRLQLLQSAAERFEWPAAMAGPLNNAYQLRAV